jgi:hydrogenase nickel incorporation protein HypA/HybF
VHELPLAQSIVDIAAGAAIAHGAVRVSLVEVTVGAFAGGAGEALRTCFQIAALGTPCEGAQLAITSTPATVWCWDCAHHSTEQPPLPDECPSCGSARMQVQGERSFTVVAVELAEVEPCVSMS